MIILDASARSRADIKTKGSNHTWNTSYDRCLFEMNIDLMPLEYEMVFAVGMMVFLSQEF